MTFSAAMQRERISTFSGAPMNAFHIFYFWQRRLQQFTAGRYLLYHSQIHKSL